MKADNANDFRRTQEHFFQGNKIPSHFILRRIKKKDLLVVIAGFKPAKAHYKTSVLLIII
jgi:hypothetical protein